MRPSLTRSTLAPALRRVAAAAIWPLAHANMRGVSLLRLRAFMFWRAAKALAVYAGISARSTSSRPSAAARWSAVFSVRGARTSMSAPDARMRSTAATSPFTTAAKSGGVSGGCDIAQPRSAPRGGDGERQSE